MRKRMLPRAMMFMAVLMTAVLLNCGFFEGGQKAVTTGDDAASVLSETPESITASPGYLGPTSLEERIFASPVVAMVRLDSVSSATESGTTYRGTKYLATLEYSFSVLEYLKGHGAEDIVAVWAAAPFFDTRQDAENALPAIVSARDAQWDNHEAIVFLQQDSGGFLPSTRQADRYYLAWGGSWMDYGDYNDGYSIASRHNKLWLPAAASGDTPQSTGDQQRFLLDVPPATGRAGTITLSELKSRIAGVTAKLAVGDGSEEYTECLERTYQYEGYDRYFIETGREGLFYRPPDQDLESGLAASSVVYEILAVGGLQNQRAEVWLDGGDADLFSVKFGDGIPHDSSGDGTNDSVQYAQRVMTARPLPAGAYKTHYNHRDIVFVPCEGYKYRDEWTVTVNAPEGTLHEMFFDPVTNGTAVAADSSNGVLKPAAFTGVDGGSATVQRIAYEAGAVTLEVTPDGALAGHVVDVIELDGSVSLSLAAADADAGDGGLRWAVASQPWEDGDTLMVRIRQAAE